MENDPATPSAGSAAPARREAPRQTLALAALCATLAAAGLARAGDSGEGWEKKEFECQRPEKGCRIQKCCEYGFGVWTREKPGSDVKEVRAVGEIDAPPAEVFKVISDYEHQKGNMPYVEEQKVFSRTEGEVVFWTVADFPLVSKRDWVIKSKLEKNFEGGKYRASWEVTEHKEAPPAAEGVVRLKINTGSWTLEPLGDGKRTRGTYYIFTDPGGSIPSFIANKANTKALPDLFEAVRKRAEKK